MKENKKPLKTLILLIVSCTIALLASEGLLRLVFHFKSNLFESAFHPMFDQVSNPALNYTLKPSTHNEFYSINSDGVRGRERRLSSTDIRTRILILGDSVTFGMGVYDYGRTYTALLEDRLNQVLSAGKIRYEVINAGVSGYNSIQALNFLKDVGVKFAPDLVVLGICLNDWETVSRVTKEGVVVDGAGKSWTIRALLRKSFVAHYTWFYLTSMSETLSKLEQGFYINSIVADKGWSEMKTAIKGIHDFSHSRDTDFLAVVFPMRIQITSDDPKLKVPQEDLAVFFNRHRIPYIDLRNLFFQHKDKNLYNDRAGVHLSEKGHAITAAALYEKMESLGFIP